MQLPLQLVSLLLYINICCTQQKIVTDSHSPLISDCMFYLMGSLHLNCEGKLSHEGCSAPLSPFLRFTLYSDFFNYVFFRPMENRIILRSISVFMSSSVSRPFLNLCFVASGCDGSLLSSLLFPLGKLWSLHLLDSHFPYVPLISNQNILVLSLLSRITGQCVILNTV